MRTTSTCVALAAAALSTALSIAPASAQTPGPRPPAPPHSQGVRTTLCSLEVKVVDGVATVQTALTLHNDGARPAEAIWVLPLPEGAVADHLETTVGGVKMESNVLDAGQARGVYEGIVRRRRDPALLEHVGRGCLRARVFPIPAQGDLEVRIGWRQVLPELNELVRWIYPVATAGVDGAMPEQVVLDLSIESSRPLRNAFSPHPGVDVRRPDDHHVRASFEGPGRDFETNPLAVYYGLSNSEFGLHALSWRKGDEPGYAMLLISPKRTWPDQRVLDRSIVFILDTSGSMKGKKIEEARRALTQFVQSLRPSDRFDVVPFSTEAEPFFGSPQPATPENLQQALQRIPSLEAQGGTNLGGALAASVPDRGPDGEHVPITVLLTDGKASVGVKDPNALAAIAKDHHAGAGARIFVLGVGDDLDAVLLDGLADSTRGTRAYARTGENVEEKVSDLTNKLSNPVLTDLELLVDGVELSRVVPKELPDLFVGSKLLVVGRYREPGDAVIRLRGKVQGTDKEYVYETTLSADASTGYDFVPNLWAERRVAQLLDAIRLHGRDQELVDEVVRLGTEYRIVTPFTSHLVVEEGLALAPTRPGGPVVYRGPGDAMPPRPGGGGGRTPGMGGPVSRGPAGPGTGGPTGPSTPGPTSPAGGGGPTTGGVVTNSEDFFMGSGNRDRVGRGGGAGLDFAALGARLRAAGVLPKDAPEAEFEALTRKVAEELQRTANNAANLGQRSGKDAVDASVWLASALQGQGDDDTTLLDLFSRRVRDKVFLLKEGLWTDRAYDAETMAEGMQKVEAFSAEHFALLDTKPELKPYLAFSERMIVVLDGQAYRIEPAAAAEAPAPESAKPEGDKDGEAAKVERR